MAQREPASSAGGEVAELLPDGHGKRLGCLEARAEFRDVPPSISALQCSATPNIQTLPSWTVGIWVASMAHMMFGAGVVILGSEVAPVPETGG